MANKKYYIIERSTKRYIRTVNRLRVRPIKTITSLNYELRRLKTEMSIDDYYDRQDILMEKYLRDL